MTGEPRSSDRSRAIGAQSRVDEGPTTIFMMRTDAIKELARFKLPPSAQLAIIASDAAAVREIKESLDVHISRITEVVERRPDSPDRGLALDRSSYKLDSRSQAILEGCRIAENDLRDAGGAYELEQVRILMRGISRQAIDRRVREGSMLAVPGPGGRRCYPTLQFKIDGRVVPGLKAVREALQTKNPSIVLNFLSRPDQRLEGRKPIDLLRNGQLDLVLEAAKRHGEQGA